MEGYAKGWKDGAYASCFLVCLEQSSISGRKRGAELLPTKARETLTSKAYVKSHFSMRDPLNLSVKFQLIGFQFDKWTPLESYSIQKHA